MCFVDVVAVPSLWPPAVTRLIEPTVAPISGACRALHKITGVEFATFGT